ncbi:hypothetical protein [Flavobacteriaceae bacterium 14752]|uniref:hypothetical protein n=1 Tax=Mesohalobacter salilacus TaxID=2491711 RepID=UPI000F64346E|nr:hypothetical protein EIG84_05825 [Flavobacteriaceae bacterium 14752]
MQNDPQQVRNIIPKHLQQHIQQQKQQEQQHVATTKATTSNNKATTKQQQATGKTTYIKPCINQQDFAQTLSNYRVFVHNYNKALPETNKNIRHYNNNVLQHKSNEDATKEIENKISLFHYSNSSSYNNWQYNKSVEKFNKENGLWLKKRKIQSVKPATVEYFAAFLHEYMTQLHKRNKIRTQAGINHKQNLPDFKLNPNNIIKQMRNGIQNLDVSTRSVRRHRQRLEECGILKDYSFHSHARPIQISFNTSVLCASESSKNQKQQKTENQTLSSDKRTVCPHTNVVVTSTFKNNKKKKEIVDNQSHDKEVKSANAYKNNYKNTKPQVAKSEIAGPAEISKKEAQYSQNLRDRLEIPFDFAAKLANGEFDYYLPIDKRRLLYEVRTGTLNADEFKEFCIQDFLKSSAKLWKNNHAAAGCWYNTYEMLMNEWFVTFAGVTFDKKTTFEKLLEYRYRLNRAKSFFDHTNWNNVRYPSDYFNLQVKDPKNVCFGYTRKFWKQKLKKDEQYQAKQAKRRGKAKRIDAQRKQDRQHNRKLKAAVNKFLKKTITFDQLTDYVTNNLPSSYLYKIPNIIQEKTKTYA